MTETKYRNIIHVAYNVKPTMAQWDILSNNVACTSTLHLYLSFKGITHFCPDWHQRASKAFSEYLVNVVSACNEKEKGRAARSWEILQHKFNKCFFISFDRSSPRQHALS